MHSATAFTFENYLAIPNNRMLPYQETLKVNVHSKLYVQIRLLL